MIAIKQSRTYRARVKLRRGDSWRVRPECEQIDGKESNFTAGWLITEDDSGIYVGEWAMVPIGMSDKAKPGVYASWVASGDLENIRAMFPPR